mgnify:CR=1 FL=1
MGKRIHVLTGHYGAGKSEISVNLAMDFARQGKKVVLADMDTVNPYFRSGIARHELEKHGIKVVVPKFANTNVDVPALTGEFRRFLLDKEYVIVMDVGGDDAGALVTGRYRNELLDCGAVIYFVINCFRPETSTVPGVLRILREIRKSSGMEIDYLINNSHLLEDTTVDDIIRGIEFSREISSITNIPVAFHAVMRETGLELEKLAFEPVFLMNRIINFPDIAE